MADSTFVVDSGFRQMRGMPTKGRYNMFIDTNTGLVLALSNDNFDNS